MTMSNKKQSKKTASVYEITIDGCGSNCTPETCAAMAAGACHGCTACDFGKECPRGGCDVCWVRCWRRSGADPLARWIEDVDGIGFEGARCVKPFDGDLPFFIPQVKDTTWGVKHSAYMLNIQRFVNKHNLRWFYKKRDFRHSYKMKAKTKVILSFCTEDDLLESIWTRQFQDWGGGKTFWQSLAEFGFDAAISVNYSCFANHPRMEHVLSLKRNLLAAQRLAEAGIPVIMDLMWHTELDFDRLVDWALENKMRWYNINCQTMKKASWAMDLIFKYADRLFEHVPDARLLINGILDIGRVEALVARYGERIALANFGAFMHTVYHRHYDIGQRKWVRIDKPLSDIWKINLGMYEGLKPK